MRAAIISLNQAWEDKTLNRKKCLDFVIRAHEKGCDLVVFPEMTLSGFSMNTKDIAEHPDSSGTISFFSGLSKEFRVNIVFGVALLSDQLPRNCAITTGISGELLTCYTKIHPFSFAGEGNHFSSGETLSHCKIKDCNVGLTICYDLRFPELYRALSETAEMIINLANWPASRRDHWETLLKARAIENQLFIVGVNRTGTDGNDIVYEKSSMIFDPFGERLTPSYSHEELDIYELDLSLVNYYRTKFPFRADRKTELYKKIL